MYWIKNLSILLIGCFLLPGICFSTEGYEELSKVGFVKNNGANVRGGDNVNFTSLCNLEEGDPVKVIGKRYSWYKVILPKKACVYIKSEYVDPAPEKGEGEVNAERVNLRAGAGTQYAILGQVSKPEKVYVVSEENGWYRITPPEGTAGWMHSSQLRFPETLQKKEEPAANKPVEKNKDARPILKQKEPRGNLRISTEGR